MTAGRPTLYDESFCDRIKEFASKGMSVAEWAAELGVARSTLYSWAEEHSEFSAALRAGKDLEQAAWERMARENLDNKNFNANLWIKSAQARFRDDYTDRQQIDTTLSAPGGGPISIVGITRTVIDHQPLSPVIEHLTIDHEPESQTE
ncbi:MAG: helix-turn-helix domain-containing protein [Allorhizobium sp.]